MNLGKEIVNKLLEQSESPIKKIIAGWHLNLVNQILI